MKKICFCLIIFALMNLHVKFDQVEASGNKINLKISKEVSYYGEIKNGKPHGQGTMKWGETKTYSGTWSNGKRSGYGKYTFIDKSQASPEGDMLDNIRTTTYVGNWINDKQNGQGVFKTSVDALHSGNEEGLLEKGLFKNNIFVKGYSLGFLSNNYISISYKDSNNEVSVNTERLLLDGANSISELIELGKYSDITFTTKDQKGNKNTISYSYVKESDAEYAPFHFSKVRYMNQKVIYETETHAELDNRETQQEIYNKIKPYKVGLEGMFSLMRNFYENI
ncbi:MORN repeat protein [compost metagenome]